MNRFTQAIVRQPGKNFADGITTSDLGKPLFDKALEQHHAYCKALTSCGVNVVVLEADERFPDGCFVEDTAIITKEVAIISRPGDSSRIGEVEKISDVISRFKKTERIVAPGFLDGGDIMRVENHYYIGLTKRTNIEGAIQLESILSKYGYTASPVTVEKILHLKTGIAYLGSSNFIAVKQLAEKFLPSNIIVLDPEEAYSANCLMVNDHLLIPKGFPKSKKQLMELGYSIIEVEMSEFRKMDGGLTCLSLLI